MLSWEVFKDRNGRDMVLAMTHEEVIADLASKEIHSYRQLPLLIYHIQTKWRDDPRPRAGLIRCTRVHDEGQLQPGQRLGRLWIVNTATITRRIFAFFSAADCLSWQSNRTWV